MIKMLALSAIAASVAACPVSAQQRGASQSPGVFVRDKQERWLYGRQQPAFTPMTVSSAAVRIVGIQRDPVAHTQTLSLAFSGNAGRPGTARLTTDRRGHIIRLTANLPSPRNASDRDPFRSDADQQLRWEVLDGAAQQFASLPETRVWDLVPVRGSTPLHVGSRWRDTLSLSASLKEYTQSLRGIRESTIIGDTVVAGVRLWIVRDSATVHFQEHLLVEERTLDTLASVDRSTDGTIVGRHLLDPELGLARIRVDTTVLDGVAVLTYADGRSFRTPARYERTQRVELLSDTAYRIHEQRRREAEDEFSIVIRPEGESERVANNDTSYIAALLDTIARSRDPLARQRALGPLRFASDPATAARLRSSMLHAGDTAFVVRQLQNAWVDGNPIDEDDLALLLPVLIDPGVAFAFGLERDPHYENARQGLLTHPPVSTRDTTTWACVPSVCRTLAAQWRAAVDPRLSSLGLIAHLTLDPRTWADTVLARFSAGDHFLEPAVTLIRGIAASWPAGSHAPLPPVGANRRAWSNWMEGHNSAYPHVGPDGLVRFENVHAQVIGFAHALSGRDFEAEWREGMRVDTSDSARFVYGSMLLGIGVASSDAPGIAERLQSSSPLMQRLAAKEMSALFAHGTPLADSATTEEIQDRVLAVAIDGATPWAGLDPGQLSRDGASAMPSRVAGQADMAYDRPALTPGPLVLRGGSLAPATRGHWERRNIRIADPGWRPRSNESVIILDVSDVRQIGPFVRVTIDQSHLTARVNGRGQSWESGTTLYLMRRGREWVIVQAATWIT